MATLSHSVHFTSGRLQGLNGSKEMGLRPCGSIFLRGQCLFGSLIPVSPWKHKCPTSYHNVLPMLHFWYIPILMFGGWIIWIIIFVNQIILNPVDSCWIVVYPVYPCFLAVDIPDQLRWDMRGPPADGSVHQSIGLAASGTGHSLGRRLQQIWGVPWPWG